MPVTTSNQTLALTLPIPVLGDAQFATSAEELLVEGLTILVLVNAYTACIYSRIEDVDNWLLRFTGEFGQQALAAIMPFSRKGSLKWAQHSFNSPGDLDLSVLTITDLRKKTATDWIKSTNGATKRGGRTGSITTKTASSVCIAAAWRCQFEGCGEDLSNHFSSGARANYGYLAHIVAASPDGPRGHTTKSAQLVDDPENIMLLCDKCHRRVDKVAPFEYTADRLNEMRAKSVLKVKGLLDSLKFRTATPVVFLGNISGQAHYCSSADINNALLRSELSPDKEPEYFLNLGGVLHDPHSSGYWSTVFQGLKTDIPALQRMLNGSGRGQPRNHLAVFPIHSTSILTLAGRLLGDTTGITVFQLHRNQVAGTPGAQWAWPSTVAEPSEDKYAFSVVKDQIEGGGVGKACLIVSLTFDIALERLTEECFSDGQLKLPSIKIKSSYLGSDVISHPKDLELLGTCLDKALKVIQDEWRAGEIHLFVGAPVSACVRIGQKMQARNQSSFLCHEAGREFSSQFKPTIKISNTSVISPNGEFIEI